MPTTLSQAQVNYTCIPMVSLTWHYPLPSCPSGKPSWPGLPRTLPSLEPGWWRAGRVDPTRSLALQRPHSLHREEHQDLNRARLKAIGGLDAYECTWTWICLEI